VSLIVLVVRAIQLIIQLIKKKPDKMLGFKFIRPSLVVVMFVVATACHRVSANRATAYAIGLADQLQTQCETNGYCPVSIDSWRTYTNSFTDRPYYSSDIRKLGINYRLRYATSADGKSFTVTLIYGFESETNFEGGVGKRLNAVYPDGTPVATKLLHPNTNALSIHTNLGK